MPTSLRTTSLLAVVALVASLLGMSTTAAELPVTVPGNAIEVGAASLLDVTVSDVGGADEVVFTFAGDVLPTVEAVVGEPPFYDIPGDVVEVPGTSFVRLRMFPARGVSFGDACSVALGEPPTPGPGETAVGLWFSCFDGLNGPAPVVLSSRLVPDGSVEEVLTATVELLLDGPTPADEAAGLSSWFSSETSGLLNSVTVTPEGVATIDFDPALATTIPNASSSAGSDQLLRELDATVLFGTGITSATYTLGGSCAEFFGWLQLDCAPRTPDDGIAALYAQTYLGPETVTGSTQNVTAAVQLEDFEAQLTWVVGLRAESEVTVSTASSPARVVVRVAHVEPMPAVSQPRFTG